MPFSATYKEDPPKKKSGPRFFSTAPPTDDNHDYEHAIPDRQRSGVQRGPSTRYMNMLLALDGIPRIYNILAAFFTWILLAGFVLFPGTFTSLQHVNESELGGTEAHILHTVRNLPLFVVAFICCGIGAIGMSWLWWRWMNNYVWLVNRIFLPGTLNSLAGIVSTLAGVYGVQDSQWSITSKLTIIVTTSIAVICGILTGIYSFWKLAAVKRKHNREVGRERAGKRGEGFVEQVKRKAREKEPEAGMV